MNENLEAISVRNEVLRTEKDSPTFFVLQIGREHLLEAARTVRRRITPEVIQSYEEWRDQSGLRSA